MIKLLGISGSLRKASYNTALLAAAAELLDDGVELEIATLHDIPLYDGDLEEADGIPQAVLDLRAQIQDCDGLILATPEYNNGIPGVFKNAIDWLSRPSSEIAETFHDLPVAVIGASPGGFGTILAQNHWLPVLRTLGTSPWFGGRLMVSRAGSVFDADGNLVDDKVREQLREFLHGFSEFVEG